MGNFIDEFRDSETARRITEAISSYSGKPLKIMEVCGTHTMSVSRYGIRGILPPQISLVSGPGCPVCVTPSGFLDAAIELSRRQDVIITTFGDLMRIPGSSSSLLKEKASGNDVRIVYSPLDSLKIAADNPGKKVIFLSVGFETTTPAAALAITKAQEQNIGNFYLLSSNKTMPEALKLLALDEDAGIDAYLYPGHVSAIIGMGFYEVLAHEYGIPGVVAGFEPLDVLYAVYVIVKNIMSGKICAENRYTRVVKKEGNPDAMNKIYEVFRPCDAAWRGIGCIPGSGLEMRDKYAMHDAWKAFDIKQLEAKEPAGCLCGQVLKGSKAPHECKLFGLACNPDNPVGACMVSSEGTCSAYYKYGDYNGGTQCRIK